MRKSLITMCLFVLVPVLGQAKSGKSAEVYGEKPTMTSKPMSLSTAIAKASEYKGKEVLLVSEVGEVCEKKGCWMGLKEGDKKARVTFKDYGFFVPVKLRGKKVRIQGEFLETKMTEGEARHYLEDAGKSKAEIDAMFKKDADSLMKEYRIVASGLEVIE